VQANADGGMGCQFNSHNVGGNNGNGGNAGVINDGVVGTSTESANGGLGGSSNSGNSNGNNSNGGL
jgi:hypothetical protein